MTEWQPRLSDSPGPLYRRVALALHEDVASGALPPGTRLPTHRELARALGTTVVTASRAYREAAGLGLVQGEVGRGTFVAPIAPVAPIASAAVAATTGGLAPAGTPGSEPIELTANYIVAPHDDPRGAGARLTAATVLWEGLSRRYPPGGADEHRRAAADWLRRPGWTPRPAQIAATSGAQHAILVTLAALARPGDTVYVEALTYHGVLTAARTLGLRLAPVAIDGQGLIPAALAEQCSGGGTGRVLFCQPSLHNPTSAVMPLERRRALADLARRHDLTVVEDSVYEFLLDAPPPPLAALAPERTCHLVSCAKALAQGLRVGYVAAPEPLVSRLQAAIAATALAAAPSLLDLATRWIDDGTARRLVESKRAEAGLRQTMARESLDGLGLVWQSHPASSHLWLELSPPWTAAAFVEQARRRGVAVNPAAPFAVAPAAAPAAVRVCLGPVAERRRLATALSRLAALAAAPPPGDEPVV
jgi:DNA-binding transcriptional MocR family regulator